MDEFGLIKRLLDTAASAAPHLVLGPGDDAAILSQPVDHELLVTTDTLLESRHFPADLAPATLAWRALMVNLSDLAAMGATPRWYLVALTAPQLTPAWIDSFARGLVAAMPPGCVLAGGNLCRGPLSVTITAGGVAPAGSALRRSSARPGELLCVSGVIGAAATGLARVQADPAAWVGADLETRATWPQAIRHYLLPEARLALGEALRGRAGACVDISDGLLAELQHLATASQVDLQIRQADVPLFAGADFAAAAVAGDDFELLFSLDAGRLEAVAAAVAPLPIHVIGQVLPGSGGVRVLDPEGVELNMEHAGYRHF